MDKQKLLKILKKDPKRNMSIIGFVENNKLDKVYNEGNSYLIIAESDHKWAYLSSTNKKELSKLLSENIIPTDYFANVEEWMVDVIKMDRELDWELKTKRYYFPDHVEIKDPQNEIDSLKEEDIDLILEHTLYGDHLTPEHLNKRIENGISAAIRKKGQLAAWGLTHDDKSLGFLHVIKKYRHRGFAKDIARYLIKKKRELNEPIYINIVVDNEKSISLSKGLGFKYDKNTSWIKLK